MIAEPLSNDASEALRRLVAVMATLRDPVAGCEWDRAQTFATIAPYTIEEAYEVADAIARGDAPDIADELGDLQLQIVFHARIAEEAGLFTLANVIDGIAAKMIRRHPHIFSDAVASDWETIKEGERRAWAPGGALAGVARGLPALLRAAKLQRRAARVGFDWPDPSGPRAKIDEELAELDGAHDQTARIDELGDLLFSIANWARHVGIDPEAALRQANAKFESRFAAMEAAAGEAFVDLPLKDKEALWSAAKRAESKS